MPQPTVRGTLLPFNEAAFSWFDLAKYSATSSLSEKDWLHHLGIRYLAQQRLSARTDANDQDREHQLVMAILAYPVTPSPSLVGSAGDNSAFNQALFGKNLTTVRELSLHDVFCLKDAFYLPSLEAAREACLIFERDQENPTLTEDLRQHLDSVVSASYSEAIRNEGVHYDDYMLEIDMNATDAQIRADFEAWLKSKRSSRRNIPKTAIGKSHMQDWVGNRVLEYIDLNLYSVLTGADLEHHVAGNLLFPDNVDVNIGEKIRKTVRPYAQKLMDHAFLAALNTQLSSDGTSCSIV